ncbi:hypothetical protein RDI58_002291 [Solanum bulbocastanum]|uniref:Amino acid transporter transmembrane domain-containing protein n=1 Tax=Solanum bulbocastanum TaxID=147425 RepID=A0AAN8UFH1_SOLBU
MTSNERKRRIILEACSFIFFLEKLLPPGGEKDVEGDKNFGLCRRFNFILLPFHRIGSCDCSNHGESIFFPLMLDQQIIGDTLKSPPPENQTMKKESISTIVITTLFYLCCSFFRYPAFGNDIPAGNLLTVIPKRFIRFE